MTRVYIGVDVGASGGIAAVHQNGVVVEVCPMPQTDEALLAVFGALATRYDDADCVAVVEKVQASPQMGVTSAFTFGGWYRAVKVALTATRIPFREVPPLRWQRTMQCLSGGDKNVTKVAAMQLFPTLKVTHKIADALLLAEYCRMTAELPDD